jgi:hypothetical protein
MDLFNSLENLLPKYEPILPFSKEKVSYTPFRVKDAKNISIILQEDNKKLALTSLVELLTTNIKGTNIMNLCIGDAEYLFLQIRSKSVDERLNLIYNKEKIQVFISDIQTRNNIISEIIQLTDDVNITVETPTIQDLLKLNTLEKDELIKASIKKISVGGEIYYVNKFVTENLQKLIDNLPMTVLPKLDEFILKQPELFVTLQTQEGDKEVSGFLSFFTCR